MTLVAHAGGWDELLIAAAAVALMVGLRLRAERRRDRREREEVGSRSGSARRRSP